MSCGYNRFVLPSIELISGSTYEINFHTYFYSNKAIFDLTGCTASLTVTQFVNEEADAVLTKSLTISDDSDDDEDNGNLISGVLTTAETALLNGKYIYKITITDGGSDPSVDTFEGIIVAYK